MTRQDDEDTTVGSSLVGDALFSANGVKLAFGKRWDGKIIHISEADRGASCGCVCPSPDCGRRLIARKPESGIAHHFAHAPLTEVEKMAGVPPHCTHGPMTGLHAYAERLLSAEKWLVLPEVKASLGKRTLVGRKATKFTFDEAKLEKRDGETIPDVILFKNDERMHVEVFVTHRCGPEKRAKLIGANISAVEIDLSGIPRDGTLATLKEAILETAPREWIHNRKQLELLARLENEAKADQERAQKRRRDTIAALSKAYVNARQRALGADWEGVTPVYEITEAGDGALLDGGSGGEGYFSVHPKVWKATILGSMLGQFHGTTVQSIVSEFNGRGWIFGQFGRSNLRDDLAKEAGLPAGGPERAVENYLGFLAQRNVAEHDGWRWKFTVSHSNELQRRKRAKELAAYEAEQRSRRRDRLASLALEIISIGNPSVKQGFRFSTWSESLIGDQSVAQIANDGGAPWSALLNGLKQTLAVLKDESEEPADDFGLPVRSALDAARQVHEARQLQRKAEAERVARLEQEKRVAGLLHAAQAILGDDHREWLARQHPNLNGLTPRQAAESSPEHCAQAHRLLEKRRAELELKDSCLSEFEREVVNILGRRELADLFIRNSHPKLPGRASPREHIKDRATMLECLDLVKRPRR